MAREEMLSHGPCPFVDQGDGRCSCRMTKQTLAQAFEFCLGGRHFSCQTYHTISWESQALSIASDESKTDLQPGTPTPQRRLPIRAAQPTPKADPAPGHSDPDSNQAVA